MKYIFAGDSWALKGFTNNNYDKGNQEPLPGDVRLADYWDIEYQLAVTPGRGNLSVLDKIVTTIKSESQPIIWIWTEPGRDYGKITGDAEFNWLMSEEIFAIRNQLTRTTIQTIKQTIKNPIAFVGGLSDIDPSLAYEFGYSTIHPSWQRWIAEKLGSRHFNFGWGACDVGWRTVYNNVKSSKNATFAWDEQIKEWCWWEEHGYFCHEHPTPMANQEFAKYILPIVERWLNEQR
jgi:hypothetical protein